MLCVFVVCSFSYVDFVRKLFVDVKFSEKGSNARQREESVYMSFVKYLEQCERGKGMKRKLSGFRVQRSFYPAHANLGVHALQAQGAINMTFHSQTNQEVTN